MQAKGIREQGPEGNIWDPKGMRMVSGEGLILYHSFNIVKVMKI